jgi:hypothetical protein
MTVEATAREILKGQRMPPEEIRAVVAADDPLFVRRLLELHRERLEEWLEEQRRLVANIERSLAGEGPPREAERFSGHGEPPPELGDDAIPRRLGRVDLDEEGLGDRPIQSLSCGGSPSTAFALRGEQTLSLKR